MVLPAHVRWRAACRRPTCSFVGGDQPADSSVAAVEEGPGHALHVFGRHRVHVLGERFKILVAVDEVVVADPVGQLGDPIGRVDELCLRLVLRLRELALADRLDLQLLEHSIEGLLDVFVLYAGPQGDLKSEDRRLRVLVVPAARLRGEAGVHERLVEAARPPAADDILEHLQHHVIRMLDRRHFVDSLEIRGPSRGLHLHTQLAPRTSARVGRRRRRIASGDRPEVLLRLREDFIRADIAHHHERRVAGYVVSPVIGHHLLSGQAGKVVLLSDHDASVRLAWKLRFHDTAAQQEGGVVLVARELGEHHSLLGFHILSRDDRVCHPLRLDGEGKIERIPGQGLDVGRVVHRGEAVEIPAPCGDEPVHLSAAEAFRSLEGDVLQEVAQPCLPRSLVPQTDAVPDERAHQRSGMVLPDQHLQSVGERPLLYLARIRAGG